MNVKTRISYILKWIIALLSICGMLIGLFTAQADGYGQAYHRLMYYTTQSNLWIGAVSLTLAIFPLVRVKNDIWEKRFYLLRYYFTVSITVTGIVFCCFLGPFAGPSYHPWSFYSFIAHVFVPVLAIVDFFIDEYDYGLKRRHILYSAVPSLVYFAVVIPLCILGVNFGRGEPFPYFFLNFASPAGVFGIMYEPVRNLGSFYWMLLFTLITLGAGFLYYKTYPAKFKNKKAR